MTPRPATIRALTAALLSAALSAGAIAQDAGGLASVAQAPRPKRVLLDMDLRASVIEPLSIDQRSIVFNDASGRAREVRSSQVAAILPLTDDAIRGSESEGLLILTDGQRFPGRRSRAPAGQDMIGWEHAILGAVSAPLDVVSEARFSLYLPTGEPVAIEPSLKDQALLLNGDRIVGFIDSLGDPIVIETDAGDLSLPADRVAGARLANAREPARGVVLWLDDGAVARVDSLESDGRGGAAVTLAESQSARLTLEQIVGAVFSAERLRPLAQIEPDTQTPIADRPALLDRVSAEDDFWTPAVLGAPDILIPEPMEAVWTLPETAMRFGAVARLPRSSWVWGDCELVIIVDEKEVLRERLNRARSSIEFAVPLRGRTLTIRLEPGAYGPIQDRVILERALILLSPGEG